MSDARLFDSERIVVPIGHLYHVTAIDEHLGGGIIARIPLNRRAIIPPGTWIMTVHDDDVRFWRVTSPEGIHVN